MYGAVAILLAFLYMPNMDNRRLTMTPPSASDFTRARRLVHRRLRRRDDGLCAAFSSVRAGKAIALPAGMTFSCCGARRADTKTPLATRFP